VVVTDHYCLDLAVSSCDDEDVVRFLKHPDLQENRQVHPSVFKPVFEHLVGEDRTAEACMVRILGLRFVALAMAELETYDAKHREFIEATCADLAKESAAVGYPECQALFVGLLATGAAKLRKDEESFVLFRQAISIARQLIASGTRCYKTLLAGLLGNYGNALRFAGRHTEAIHALTEAVELRRQRPGHDAELDRRHLASALSDLAAGFVAEKRFREAETLLVEATGIHRQLPLNKLKARRALAGALSNLALLYTEQRRFHAATEVTEEALSIRRALAAEMPDAHLADLGTTLSNLGMLLDDLRDFNGAANALREAIAIRRSLAQAQPSVFNADLAKTLNNLGNVLAMTETASDLRAAFAAYTEALDIRRRLAAENPELHGSAVAQTLGNIAALRLSAGQLPEAILGFEEVITVLSELPQGERAEHLPQLAGVFGNLGSVLFRSARYAEARKALENAVGFWTQLAGAEPEVYEGQLAGTLNDLSLCLSKLGLHEDALQTARKAIAFAERLEDYLHLAKGDVSGAYWLVMTEAVQRRSADEVYAGLATVRDPAAKLNSGSNSRALVAAQEALSNTEQLVEMPLRLVIVEKLADDHILFGVLSSDTQQFSYEITTDFVPSARSLFALLHDPFTDSSALRRGVDSDQAIELGEDSWVSLPEFVQDALEPTGKHDVLLCGDPDSLDLPWEAMRFGSKDDDWLGLHRTLTRVPCLSEDVLTRLGPEACGGNDRSAAVVCPWDIPNQVPLPEALAEAMEVTELLRSASVDLVPDGEPLLGSAADIKGFHTVLMRSPAIIHFAGHGDIVRDEVNLVLRNSDGDNGDTLFGRHDMVEVKKASSRPSVFSSRPLVVLNACWAGRSRDFGGQREDLASAFLAEGASCVIAYPTPVHDDVGRMLGTLLYVPAMHDSRGLAFTFKRVRSLVQRKCRGTSYWWTWFWMRYQGNPYARLQLRTCSSDQPMLREYREPQAIKLVRDFFSPYEEW